MPPAGVPISLNDLLSIAQNIGGFLLTLGGILATITIVIAGIMYVTAGNNQQRVATAKGVLKSGIIGALIIFSVGIIVTTVKGFATNPNQFFGGGGNCPGNNTLPVGAQCCSGNDCASAFCNQNANPPICQ